ncbi:MAG: cation transporter [Candidatus Hydrogenedentes bacterium]|nr:cation transporter [Candidatus Hydrogenedentota bacterium]
MGHDHAHGQDLNENRLAIAVVANVLLTVAQVIGGLVSGSLALVADALHNLNDATSLGIAWLARRISRRPADEQRTFGYRRAEIIGALVNFTTLILIGLYLVYEAIVRFFQPQEIHGWTVVVLAGLALVVDVVTAFITYAGSKSSMNIKAAFIHNVSDALASVAVIVVGTLILLYEWYIVDPIVTLLIAAYVLYQGGTMLPRAIGILMEGVPPGLDIASVRAALMEPEAVIDAHHLHAWQLDEHHCAMEAHIVVAADNISEMEQIKATLREICAKRFHIHHTTLELELPEPGCGQDGGHCQGN